MNPQDDVIAAIATPIGEGGISVIRVSGRDAIKTVDKSFRGKNPLHTVSTHTAHFGYIADRSSEVIDEVIATVFRGPHSYTTEDSVEISCHGGIFVTKKILDAVLSCGARLAEPGEFTKRAFLNGRIDLSQAEAVADIICSQSELSHRASVWQLQGQLSNKVGEIRERLINVCSLLELELDFVEEGIEFTNKQFLANEVGSLLRQINQLIESYKVGRVYREGVKVVLVGKPNVGKSSIFNILLNHDRAIVTHIPGTTRDTIEENVTINGLLFKIVDTAGLRSTNDLIEIEGVKRTEKQIEQSDMIVFVIDSSSGFDKEDQHTFFNVQGLKPEMLDSCILVINKIDIEPRKPDITLPDELTKVPKIFISAKTCAGMESLRKSLIEIALPCSYFGQSHVITNTRHKESLSKTAKCLVRALDCIKDIKSNELIAFELRQAMNFLGEIVGTITTDEILNNIFARFCIGK
jgi:tRNA modification GTPase